MSFLNREDRPQGDATVDPVLSRDSFYGHYPALFEYLTALTWPDGKRRQTATLTVMVDDGTFRACVNDRAQQRSLWRSGASFDEALDAVEKALSTGSNDWRRNQQWQGKRK